MRTSFTKLLSFGTLAVLILSMMAATFLERLQGTPAAFRLVYHNPVFFALWAILAAAGLYRLFSPKPRPGFFTRLLHVSFVVILLGALTTFLWGRSGEIHLRTGEPLSAYELEDGRLMKLPFTLELKQFRVRFALKNSLQLSICEIKAFIAFFGTPISISE